MFYFINFILKITNLIYRQIEKHIPIKQLGGTEILLYEWGTMGQNQPTVGDLFNLLVRSELFRAADFLAEVLKSKKSIFHLILSMFIN